MNGLESRLEKLENRTRFYRAFAVSMSLLFCAVLFVGAAADEKSDTLQVKSIEFMNDEGEVALEVDAEFLFVMIQQSQRAASLVPNDNTLRISPDGVQTPQGLVKIIPERKKFDGRNLPFEPFVVPAK